MDLYAYTQIEDLKHLLEEYQKDLLRSFRPPFVLEK